MSRLLGYGLMLLGLAWVGFLFWVAAHEGARPKPLPEWPVKVWAMLAAGVGVAAVGAWVVRRRASVVNPASR